MTLFDKKGDDWLKEQIHEKGIRLERGFSPGAFKTFIGEKLYSSDAMIPVASSIIPTMSPHTTRNMRRSINRPTDRFCWKEREAAALLGPRNSSIATKLIQHTVFCR